MKLNLVELLLSGFFRDPNCGTDNFEVSSRRTSSLTGEAARFLVKSAITLLILNVFQTASLALAAENSANSVNSAKGKAAALLERARAHVKSYNNCPAALQEAEELIRIHPKNLEAYWIKARCLDYLKGPDPAVKTLEEALAINPKSAICLKELGNLYDSTRQYGKAVDCYTRALEVSPKNLDLLHMRSMAYGALKKYDLAIADMNRFISISPDRSRAYEWRASAFEQAGRWEKAIADLDKAMTVSPKNKLEFLAHRADLFARLKKYKEAEADYTVLLKANSLDDSFWLKRGDCRMAMNKFDAAIGDYTETIDLNESSTAYFARSKAYERIGRLDLAQKDKTVGQKLLKKKMVEPI